MTLAGILGYRPERHGRRWGYGFAALVVVGIGLVHYLGGPDYEFHIFYLLPVIAVSWYLGRSAGLWIALFSIADWLLMDWLLLARGGRPIVVFNELVRLAVLLVAGHLAARLRQVNDELEQRVRERTAELAHANESLLRNNLELQRFAFIAAHDLQTPLRSIVGFAQLLQRNYGARLDADADEFIRHLVDNTRRMHDMILDMQAYSRVEFHARSFAAVDLGEALRAALSGLEPAIRAGGATVSSGVLPTVSGERSQLILLLQHLVDNGIKYRGEAPPRVQVEAEPRGDEWLVSVRDNGIGIDPRYHERVFDIFYRLHTRQAYPGSGIGLALCRRIVERHGGRIWVESEGGRGSVFRFTLPAGLAGEPARQRYGATSTSQPA